MALDVYVKEDIANVLRAVFIAAQPGEEGCRILLAVALAFGCVALPGPQETLQEAVRKMLEAPPKRIR